jgi:hypothetical protein
MSIMAMAISAKLLQAREKDSAGKPRMSPPIGPAAMIPTTKEKAANPTNALARFSMSDLLLFRQTD